MSFLSRMLVRLLIAVMLVAMVLIARHTYESFNTYQAVDEARDRVDQHVKALEQEILALKEEHWRFKNDKSYYEQLGRQEFGMIGKDETVFIVPHPRDDSK